MDTVAHRPGSDGGDGTRTEFLPPESPTVMPKQSLRGFRSGEEKQRAVLSSMAFRRAWIFTGTAALTMAGCYEMHQVLNVGGVTALEWIVLCLFVLLFAWIAFSFMSTLAGFVVLLFRTRDPLGIDPDAPLPSIGSKNAMLLPTYNEDPGRIMARLGAMCESIEQSGYGSRFDWFILSDTTNPSIWIAEQRCFLRLRQDLGASNIFYRHRPENSARKSGNIEEWIKRFGAGYDHMVILDADSLMTGDTIVRLASAMENHPSVALIQTLPIVVNAKTLFARLQQFSGRLYGPLIAAGIAWWHGSEGNYWGHNAIIRVRAFAQDAGLPDLHGRKPFGGHEAGGVGHQNGANARWQL
jgi:membrane glycosyltransferase